MLEPSTATVFKGARRRYFSREAAARSLARAAINRHCECEGAVPADGYPGLVCDLHKDGERYARLVDYISRRYLRRALGKGENR